LPLSIRDAGGIQSRQQVLLLGASGGVDVFDGGCVTATTETTLSLVEPLEAEIRLAWGYNARAELDQVLQERSSRELHLDPPA
jgi:hypothetical protein